MARSVFAFVAGALFGTGLLISGMTNTTKVQGWLDLFGDWDPTLAFVMGAAILPMALAWAYSSGRKPVLGEAFPAKPDQRLGPNLIVGSSLFGMGWGLAGFCPGPALAALTFGGWPVWIFAAAMALGMLWAPLAKAQLDRALPAE